MSDTQQLCTFYVVNQHFGVPVAEVQEIIRDQPTTRIPLAPSAVAGLINLRGQIVPIIDLRRCLGLPDLPSDTPPTHIVLATEGGAVSLRVDQIGDVLDLPDGAFETTPDNLRGATKRLVKGVYKLERGLLLALSSEVAIDLAISSTAAHFDHDASAGRQTTITH